MRWAHWMLALSGFLLTFHAFATQLPPSEALSSEDAKGMNQELERWKQLLPSTNDPCAVEFQIARTYAAGGQYREAMDWLQKTADGKSGLDPSRDQLFAKLQRAKEFQSLVARIRANAPPVSTSYLVATIPDTNLFPENFAYDPKTKTFLIGSTFKDKIVRCTWQGTCHLFTAPSLDGSRYVLGMKVHQRSRTLWVCRNSNAGASLLRYSLVSGRLLESYVLPGAHVLNDLAVSPRGDVFVTDTKGGAIYMLSSGRRALERIVPNHVFTTANGVALSPDGTKLYISAFGDGISIVDLRLRSVTPLPHPADVCLASIDGLYSVNGYLIAIQNGPMIPRLVRFTLSPGGGRIVRMKVLERRNPLFDGITTGVVVGRSFYYIANTQIDKKSEAGTPLHPLRILAATIATQ